MTHDVTIILPCAGRGTRLGFPFPKELAPLAQGRVVIDSCLDLISALPAGTCRVVVMDDGKREATISHIRWKLSGVPLAQVRQDEHTETMPSGILRLEPWFSAINIVMLPDVVYSAGPGVLTRLAELVARDDFAFAAAKMGSTRLKELGALRTAPHVVPDVVVAYCDKPGNPDDYTAAWGMIGFSNQRPGRDGLSLISLSTGTTHCGAISVPPMEGAPVVWLDDIRDCGTWPRYHAELTRE